MHTDGLTDGFDAVVIGGSYAGLAASLQLARTRRRVLVIDAGVRRNRFATTSHGFLGQDGRAPGDIIADGRAEVLAYPTVSWVDGLATHAARTESGFQVTLNDDQSIVAKRVVLAMGVVDELPSIEGLAERWGTSVFHCPYCHGYELHNGRIGVLAAGPLSHHHAMLLPDWGRVTLFTNGVLVPDPAEADALSRRGVVSEPVRIKRIVERATVELEDGRVLPFDGLFTMTRTHVASPVARQLDCAFDEGPLGSLIIRTDATKATTVPGVFACGDATRAAGSVALAVGDGAQAGISAHRSLVFGT